MVCCRLVGCFVICAWLLDFVALCGMFSGGVAFVCWVLLLRWFYVVVGLDDWFGFWWVICLIPRFLVCSVRSSVWFCDFLFVRLVVLLF